jgi:hypothetical protein
VLKTLKKLSFNERFDYERIYPSNDDAVHSIMQATLTAAVESSALNSSMALDENLAAMSETSNQDFNDVFNAMRLDTIDEIVTVRASGGAHDNPACVRIDIEDPDVFLSDSNKATGIDADDKDVTYPMSVYKKRNADNEIDDILD